MTTLGDVSDGAAIQRVPLEPSVMLDAEKTSTRRSSGRFTGGISSGDAVLDTVTPNDILLESGSCLPVSLIGTIQPSVSKVIS